MKRIFLVAAMLCAPLPAAAEGALFQKQSFVSGAELANRTPPPADPSGLIESLRWQVLDESNRVRAEFGLAPLTGDPTLDASAARYSRKMRDLRFFDHVAPDGETLDERLPEDEMWRYAGLAENLWSGQGALDWDSNPLSRETVTNWMESPGHRENLLDPAYTLGGVGAAMVDDRLYITMLYGTAHEDPGQAELLRDYGDAPSDPEGLVSTLEQRLADLIATGRQDQGLAAQSSDPSLASVAADHSAALLMTGGLSSVGLSGQSVLETAFAAGPGRSGRLSAGFWRGSGGIVWQADALAETILQSWRESTTWSEILDPALDQIGIGAATDGTDVVVTVLFGEASGV